MCQRCVPHPFSFKKSARCQDLAANRMIIKAWVLAHIQLTREEAKSYANQPVVYDGEFGFVFEPNE